MSNGMPPPTGRGRPSRLYRLETWGLAFLILSLACLCSWTAQQIYELIRQRKDSAAIEAGGGGVDFGDRGYGVRLGNADPKHLNSFREAMSLDLAGMEIGDDGLEDLADFESLAFLDLTGCRISDDDLAILKQSHSLKYLFLGDTLITDEGLAHLAGLEELEILVLDGTRVTDSGLTHLKSLKLLRQLALWGTRVSDEAILGLNELPRLESVSLPDLDDSQSDPEPPIELRPGIEIYRQPTILPR